MTRGAAQCPPVSKAITNPYLEVRQPDSIDIRAVDNFHQANGRGLAHGDREPLTTAGRAEAERIEAAINGARRGEIPLVDTRVAISCFDELHFRHPTKRRKARRWGWWGWWTWRWGAHHDHLNDGRNKRLDV